MSLLNPLRRLWLPTTDLMRHPNGTSLLRAGGGLADGPDCCCEVDVDCDQGSRAGCCREHADSFEFASWFATSPQMDITIPGSYTCTCSPISGTFTATPEACGSGSPGGIWCHITDDCGLAGATKYVSFSLICTGEICTFDVRVATIASVQSYSEWLWRTTSSVQINCETLSGLSLPFHSYTKGTFGAYCIPEGDPGGGNATVSIH